MRFLSLFSGIEAASEAWIPLGWEPAAFAEIEPFPAAVLKHHHPAVPNLGDVRDITDEQIRALGPMDVVVGGFPCQDLSIAGKRAGLNGERSSLFHEALRIYHAARTFCNARWFIIENVPGLFSTNHGNDFAVLVGALVGSGYGVPADGWRTAGAAVGPEGLSEWRVLDAQYVRTQRFPTAVPQRRRRVFIVHDSGNWADRPPVLLEAPHMCGDRPARCRARQGSAAIGGAAAEAGGEPGPPAVANPLTARMAKGINTTLDEGQTAIAVPFDTTQLTSGANYSNPKPGDPCHPLAATAHPPAVAFNWQNGGGYGNANDGLGISNEHSPPCSVSQVAAVAQGWAVRRLTPRECERLQGFPDDHTRIPYRGKPASKCPDGPRYRALGNSMAVNCMQWIGERIANVHDQLTDNRG